MRMLRQSVMAAGCLVLMVGGITRGEERKYLLERVEDVAVIQIYADGFKSLTLKEKLLALHLTRASIAGRDIYYSQRNAYNLDARTLLEEIVRHPDGVNPKTLAAVTHYLKRFWINSGPYHDLTARKFVLQCTPLALESALKIAVENGSTILDTGDGKLNDRAHAVVESLAQFLFDPDFQAVVTNKTPGPGKDILASSANNLYLNVTMNDLLGFQEHYPLNSQLRKINGKLTEDVWRVGGMYSEQIERIITHLKDAKAVAPEPTAKALDALITFYTTGEEADRKEADIAWVRDKDANVDTINGFIEVYMDPRGVKGSWESAVSYVNKEKTGAIKKLAGEAQWFEDRMPWDAAFRKSNVKGITANVVDILIETGDCGPVSPIGINLPNDQKVRETDGSKSVSLANIVEASDKATPTTLRAEFSWSPEEAARATKWSTLAAELLVNMHEVIGHASGKLSETLKGPPQANLKEYYSALEEGRADLVALYFMSDPKLASLGLVSPENQEELARTAYENYTRNALVQLRRVREGSQLEEDHMRNRQMVVRWLIANTKAVEVRNRDEKTYYVMTDAKAFREGIGKLLAEVQRIKSEGDLPAAKKLFDTHGIPFDPKLRDEVVARVKKLDLPSYNAYVMPELSPVVNGQGEITDVAISYPLDFTKQMLQYSALGRGK